MHLLAKIGLGAVGGITGLTVLGAIVGPPPPEPAAAAVLTVTRAVDGDTVELSDGRRIRLLGIDAPELGSCGFDEATAFAHTTLVGKTVTEATYPTQAEVDDRGRALRYLAVDGTPDFSTATADAGWATNHILEGKPVTKEPAIRSAEDAAKVGKRGIWGPLPCTSPTPTSTPAPTTTPQPARDDGDPKPQPRPNPQPNPNPQPKPQPAPAPERDNGGSSGPYSSCGEVPASEKPVLAGDPGYSRAIDRDGDGRACER